MLVIGAVGVDEVTGIGPFDVGQSECGSGRTAHLRQLIGIHIALLRELVVVRTRSFIDFGRRKVVTLIDVVLLEADCTRYLGEMDTFGQEGFD